MKPKIIADFEEDNQLNIEKMIEAYNGYIYTILKNCMENKEDIEEMLSDVFMILWKNYKRMDKNMEVKPYLVGVAKNLIRKKYRDIKLENHMESIENYENEVSDYIDVQALMESSEKSKIIENVLKDRKPQEQQIFIGFYYKAKKVKEISQELKISETRVKVTLHRLRKMVKKRLKERGYNYGKE